MSVIIKDVQTNDTTARKTSRSKIEIVEVKTKKELWSWVRFPNELYKDNEFFVPFFACKKMMNMCSKLLMTMMNSNVFLNILNL